MNNSEALTTLIVGGRTAKEYSQRELARRVGISNSSLNDIDNGRVAKPDPEILKRIAEELGLSLQQLLKAAGYNEVMSWFSHDEFKNKSTKDLKNTIEECRLFKYDILDWDANKRKKALKILRKNGELVYSTCSILQEENEAIIKKFLNLGIIEIVPINDEKFKDLPKLPTSIDGVLCVKPTELYEGFFVAKLKLDKEF